MTEIIVIDQNVPVPKRKSVVLSVVPIETSKYAKRIGMFKITRTNGITTETFRTSPRFNGKGWRTEHPCTEEDRYDYEQDVKVIEGRNDKLMKDANEMYNLLFKKGYLCKIMGFRGRVKSIDARTAKLIINTEYDSKVICALL
jgi:hypothetical protein